MDDEFAEIIVCRICNQEDGIDNDLLHDKDEMQAHYFCLLFSSGLGQKGKDDDGIRGFMTSDIRKEIKRGARLKCNYCHKKGATVGCAEQRCKKSYHLPCGYKNDSLQQYFDQFKSFCKEHRPTQKPGRRGGKRADKSDNICTICQEKVIRKATCNVIWSPCCLEYFHRNCIQQWAYSQGSYLFRCPHCQNDETFGKEMKVMGIYIPVQDAAWETGNNFADVEEAPPHLCHAKICFCPQEEGRAFNKEHGLWEVLPCRSCGSRGIHAKCGGLEDYPEPVWDCYNCRTVMSDRAPELLPHTEKLWSHLESNHLISKEINPKLLSKLDALRTQADKQRSDGGSSTSSSEESPVYREKRSPVSSCSSPNKLFEALLATLPYLNEMEDNVNQFSDTSISTTQNNLQLTITPVYTTNPSTTHTHNSHNSNESSTISYTNNTTTLSSRTTSASQPASVTIFESKGQSADHKQLLNGGNHHQLINGGGNGLLITALPNGGSVPSNRHTNGATNGIHSYTTKGKVQTNIPAISMETDTSPASIKIPQSLTIAPVIENGSHNRVSDNNGLTSPINLSINNKADRVDIHKIPASGGASNKSHRSQGKSALALVRKQPNPDKSIDINSITSGNMNNGNGMGTVTNGRGASNGVYHLNGNKNGSKKEMYDYTLEDIIRSRLIDNGDIAAAAAASALVDNKANKYMTTTTASTADFNKKTIGGADLYTSKMINDGVQVNGMNGKKAPVFRILNGAESVSQGPQRKIPQYFNHRK